MLQTWLKAGRLKGPPANDIRNPIETSYSHQLHYLTRSARGNIYINSDCIFNQLEAATILPFIHHQQHPPQKRKISNTFPMAKSLRSKTKRAFRSKKRQEGIYAAAAAGRLHRLNAKLQQATKKDLDEDVQFKGGEEDEEEPGWCWFATFGLLDPNDITLDGLECLATGQQSYGGESTSAPWVQSRCYDSSEDSI